MWEVDWIYYPLMSIFRSKCYNTAEILKYWFQKFWSFSDFVKNFDPYRCPFRNMSKNHKIFYQFVLPDPSFEMAFKSDPMTMGSDWLYLIDFWVKFNKTIFRVKRSNNQLKTVLLRKMAKKLIFLKKFVISKIALRSY